MYSIYYALALKNPSWNIKWLTRSLIQHEFMTQKYILKKNNNKCFAFNTFLVNKCLDFFIFLTYNISLNYYVFNILFINKCSTFNRFLRKKCFTFNRMLRKKCFTSNRFLIHNILLSKRIFLIKKMIRFL